MRRAHAPESVEQGHPGGITTIHANSAQSALTRLEQLTAEASQQPMQPVIGEAVDLIVSIEKTARGRVVRNILHVEGFARGEYRIQSCREEEQRVA